MADEKNRPGAPPSTDHPSGPVLDDKEREVKDGPLSPADTSLASSDLEEGDVPTPNQQIATRGRIWDTVYRIWKWTPKPARYDPNNPPKFTVWMNILFAFAGCFTVSNLYYNQAILNRIAESFDVTFEKASSVATLMQAGYAAGLLLICPLGDLFPRRPFIIGLVAFTATLWLVLCFTTSFSVFAAVSFICGATTVTPQLLLPLVGDLAPAHRRASSLAIVVSGLSLGVLVARILAGVMANYTDWRNIYWFGFGVQYLVLALLYVWMPDYPSKNPEGLNYFRMLATIGHLLFTEPLLFQASLIAFLLSATFTSFWTTLSFLLSSPPYNYSSMVIGLFGLIGVVLILSAPVYSRLVIDKMVPLFSAIMGLLLELTGLIIGTSIGSFNVAGPVIQAITIDVGSQFTQIANRAAIYGIRPDARNRVNTAYMVMAFSGQLTGTAVGNRLYAQGGWVYSGSCSIAFIVFGLIVCVARGPKEKGWYGWSGGWAIRNDIPRKQRDTPIEKALEEAAGLEDSKPNQETKK
ncbi:major facilitator superfamily domain-containing protein [Lasiosphaeris hirsuta]|uniref:Major facilitator superfamily domain-containing protein n=1 Tax=Lasiosphaeris hirsuta TaxID=260670 RepID=A0AA40AGV1_9PEZI|nr:major facilitator superfamily domain-containing protein [Lasiosphaeris hirsuta]